LTPVAKSAGGVVTDTVGQQPVQFLFYLGPLYLALAG
jgi:hypothetical protein